MWKKNCVGKTSDERKLMWKKTHIEKESYGSLKSHYCFQCGSTVSFTGECKPPDRGTLPRLSSSHLLNGFPSV